MATTLCSRATTMTTPSSSFTISSLSTTRLNRRICERNQDLLLSRQRRRQKRCFFSFDAKSAATTPPGSDDEVEFNIDADSIAKRVFREKNNENNNSINVKEGTVLRQMITTAGSAACAGSTINSKTRTASAKNRRIRRPDRSPQ